jgi:hypothetical protein
MQRRRARYHQQVAQDTEQESKMRIATFCLVSSTLAVLGCLQNGASAATDHPVTAPKTVQTPQLNNGTKGGTKSGSNLGVATPRETGTGGPVQFQKNVDKSSPRIFQELNQNAPTGNQPQYNNSDGRNIKTNYPNSPQTPQTPKIEKRNTHRGEQ